MIENGNNDLALLLSSCNDVVSAEVPNELRKIAECIKDPQQFLSLNDDEALQFLRSGTTQSSDKFKNFLLKHGHRGYKEFDAAILPWGEDPIPVLKTIRVCFF